MRRFMPRRSMLRILVFIPLTWILFSIMYSFHGREISQISSGSVDDGTGSAEALDNVKYGRLHGEENAQQNAIDDSISNNRLKNNKIRPYRKRPSKNEPGNGVDSAVIPMPFDDARSYGEFGRPVVLPVSVQAPKFLIVYYRILTFCLFYFQMISPAHSRIDKFNQRSERLSG